MQGLSVVAACILGQALPLWVLTGHPPVWAASAALALSGVANGLVNPSIHALMTLRIPAELRPTVLTVMMMVYGLTQPIAVFAIGPMLDRFGAQPVLVAFAAVQTVAMVAIAVSALAVRADDGGAGWRRAGREPAPQPRRAAAPRRRDSSRRSGRR